MAFIETLCDGECILRSKGCLALERSEIVELWRNLSAGFGLFGDFAGFFLTSPMNRFGEGFVPNAFSSPVRLCGILFKCSIDPFARVSAFFNGKVSVYFVIIFRCEGFDFSLAACQDCKGRGLHTASGCNVESSVS